MNRKEIETAVRNVIAKANSKFGVNLPVPTITFYSVGRAAGRAYLNGSKLEFHEALAAKNSSQFMDTIIHEVAHIFTTRLYPHAKQNHGPEFRSVCRALGGSGTTRHNFDVSEVATVYKTKRYEYKCSCRTHMITATKHNRSVRGTNMYSCKFCRQPVVFTGKCKVN